MDKLTKLNQERMRAQEHLDDLYASSQINKAEWSRRFDLLSNPECADYFAAAKGL